MITLRPYQHLVLDEAHQHARERPILVCPTGSGKSVIGAEVGFRVVHHERQLLWLVHRRELVEQAVEHLQTRGLDVGVIMSGESARPRAPVQVASTQTLQRRETPRAHVLVYDEVHHSTAKGNQNILTRPEVQSMLWVGLTATPARLDGTGLREAGWGHLVQGPSVRELIAQGHLSPYKYFAPVTPDMRGVTKRGGDYAKGEAAERMKIVGDAVDLYRQFLTDGKALGFCVTVEHSQRVAKQFSDSGIPALHLDAKTSATERSEGVERFRAGEVRVLCNVGLFDEGFDAPDCDGVLLMRPTRSLVVARQQVGRALRPAPGKEHAVILDMAGNWSRVGLPDEHIEWSLDGKAKRQAEQQPWRTCPGCWAIIPVHARVCPECGRQQVPVRRRDVRHQRGVLREIQQRLREENADRPVGDRRELYWRCLMRARGRGWRIKRARLDYLRASGYGVDGRLRDLEEAARTGCPHTVMEGGYCRFCGEPGGLLGGVG